MKKTVLILTRLALYGVSVASLTSLGAWAHDGHDHGVPNAVVVNLNSPQRLPDGALAVPKPSQRQLGIRTQVVQFQAAARSVELPGLVIMDPNAGGRVQSTTAGRIAPGQKGLPVLGQRVQQGELLAHVKPTLSVTERASLGSQLAEARVMQTLALQRLERLRMLTDSVPRKDIEAAEAEWASLTGRLESLESARHAEPLLAPISGVIASSRVVAGQVVQARELVFEIVDPERLTIEVTAPPVGLGGPIESATVRVASQVVSLTFVGAGRILREQMQPLQFRASQNALSPFSVGQPVAVTVKLKQEAQGVAVPQAAVVRSAANEPLIWVKTAAERFEPRRVMTQPLDAAHVLVVRGLKGGEWVVTEGAPLINQIR